MSLTLKKETFSFRTRLEFLKDFKKLLKKYKATIYADIAWRDNLPNYIKKPRPRPTSYNVDVRDYLLIHITFEDNINHEIYYPNEYLNEEVIGWYLNEYGKKEEQNDVNTERSSRIS